MGLPKIISKWIPFWHLWQEILTQSVGFCSNKVKKGLDKFDHKKVLVAALWTCQQCCLWLTLGWFYGITMSWLRMPQYIYKYAGFGNRASAACKPQWNRHITTLKLLFMSKTNPEQTIQFLEFYFLHISGFKFEADARLPSLANMYLSIRMKVWSIYMQCWQCLYSLKIGR